MTRQEYYEAKDRYLSPAPTVIGVPFLESRPRMVRRKIDAARTLSPAAIHARSRRQSTTDNGASSELGHGKPMIGNRIAWAVRQLRLGGILARYGWGLETEPKRLSVELACIASVEVLLVRRVGESVPERFAELTWADVSANDWYLVTQLELAR